MYLLDYIPQIAEFLSLTYFAVQTDRYIKKRRLRAIVYGGLALLNLMAFIVANTQFQALQEHDQAVAMSADCITDTECEQLELAPAESEAEE